MWTLTIDGQQMQASSWYLLRDQLHLAVDNSVVVLNNTVCAVIGDKMLSGTGVRNGTLVHFEAVRNG